MLVEHGNKKNANLVCRRFIEDVCLFKNLEHVCMLGNANCCVTCYNEAKLLQYFLQVARFNLTCSPESLHRSTFV